MHILNRFKNNQIDKLSKEIYNFILNEKNLSKRNQSYIQKLFHSSNFYVALNNNNKILGFIAKEKLIENYFEIKSWYVIPPERGTSLANKLFLKAVENTNNKYLCVTFQKRLVKRITQFGFKQTSITKLPIKVIIAFLSTRPWKSVLRHLFLKRSYLLLTK